MGRRLRRRRHREASTSAMPSCAGNTTINEASAMLLYEAPFGIALFSFDGSNLNNSVKDFWADIPQLALEFFLKYEQVSTPIDLTNGAIDDHLTKKLTRLCGSEKTLVVGRSQHRTIIEKKLGITCLYFGVPDCEVTNCSLKNPMRTLLPEEKSGTNKRDCPLIGKELIAFLHQHNFDVRPEMVNESIVELARQLHDTKLRQIELLKFFRILLNDFIVTSGIDTKHWMIFQFATVPKMICCPGSSYQIYHPVKIFSRVEYRKIEANASRYKRSFSKIGVLSVYEEVVSLHSKKCLLLHDLDSLLGKAKGDMKIREASTLLLYEAPFGIALFSFDGAYLNNSVKDFWADVPQFSLKEFIKCENVSTLFDPANDAIDDHLAEKLTRHCGSAKKLVVGSAQHKTIIEKKLGITCLHVDVPNFEAINCSLKNPMHTLLPQEKSETNKTDRLSIGKELITFLRQHNFDVKPEMVNESIAELAHQLNDTKLCQMKLLEFFRILLKDFIVKSGIDTKNWMLFQFATVPKMMCCPGSSYQIYHPVKIFSRVEYRKIEANASRYKASFSKIGVLSVYEKVVSLHSKKCLLLHDLDSLLKKAKDAVQEQTTNVDDFKEIEQAEDTGDDRKKLTTSTPGLVEIKQNRHTGTIKENMNLPKNRDTGSQSMDSDRTKPENGGDTGVQSMDVDNANPASSDIPYSEQLKGRHSDTSVKKNPPEINGADANYEKARDDTMNTATGGIPESWQLKDQHSGKRVPESTSDDGDETDKEATDVQSMGSDKRVTEITSDDDEKYKHVNPASGPKCVSLRDLMYEEMKREADEASSSGDASLVSADEASSSGDASLVSSGPGNSDPGGKMSDDDVPRRCMPFVCCYRLH